MINSEWIDRKPSIEDLTIAFNVLRELAQNYHSQHSGWSSLIEGQRMVLVETRNLYGDDAAERLTESR